MDHPKTPTGEFPRHLPDCKCATCQAAEDKRRRAWERLSGTACTEPCGAYECHENGCKRAAPAAPGGQRRCVDCGKPDHPGGLFSDCDAAPGE